MRGDPLAVDYPENVLLSFPNRGKIVKRGNNMAKSSNQSRPKLKHSVTIAGNFGSQIQKDFALRTLADILAAWKREVESRHKKNTITITNA